MAKRVSIINFKGGVGKSTLAFHLGTGLARYHDGQKVLLVDVDHQSSLSILCLGTQWKESVQQKRTINEVFRPFIGQNSAAIGKNIITQDPMGKRPRVQHALYRCMDLVPSSLELDDIEIQLTASQYYSTQGDAINSEWDKRTLICRWLEEAEIDGLYDYIIFDCPPATKIVSQNAIAASHGYIIPVVPEAVMERGAPHLVDMMKEGIDGRLKKYAGMMEEGQPRRTHVLNTELVGLVITRIQSFRGRSGYTNDHTQHLSSLKRHWGDQLIEPYIRQGTGVSEALARGVPVYDQGHTQNVGGRGLDAQFKKLTDELKRRIDAL